MKHKIISNLVKLYFIILAISIGVNLPYMLKYKEPEEVEITLPTTVILPQGLIKLPEHKEAVKEEYKTVEYLGEFLLTGYCDCEECQEEWVGTTAIGVAPKPNHTVAVDPNVIPLGSHLLIDDIEYVAEDVGGLINGKHIDIFVRTHNECYSDFCNGYHEVYQIIK